MQSPVRGGSRCRRSNSIRSRHRSNSDENMGICGNVEQVVLQQVTIRGNRTVCVTVALVVVD